MLLALPAPLSTFADTKHPIVQGATPGTATLRSCGTSQVIQTWNTQPGFRIEFEVQCPDCTWHLHGS